MRGRGYGSSSAALIRNVSRKIGSCARSFARWAASFEVICIAARPGGGRADLRPLLATSWQDDDAAVDESCAATIGLEPDGSVSVVSKTGKAPTDCPIHGGHVALPPTR